MYVVTVKLQIKPAYRAVFDPLMREQARASLAEEPGCHRFDICEPEDDGDAIFLYELYEDRSAFDLHLQSEHFRRFDMAVADMVESKSVATMRLLEP